MSQPSSSKAGLHLALIVFVGVIVYSNTFNVPFVFDDEQLIVNNERIRAVSNIPSMFVEMKGYGASRPLMHVVNALNYHFGKLDAAGYHAVNLALHLINGVLLYLLIVMTGKSLAMAEGDVRFVAVASALLFVVHPAQTEAVVNIQNRSMLLSAAFYFLGLIFFLKAVTTGQASYFAALAVTSLLGMASRENFVVFPIVLFLYDFLLVSRARLKNAVKHYKIYLPVIPGLAYFAYLALSNTYISGAEVSDKGIAPMNYVLTEFRVHWTYVRLLLLPFGQTLDYDYPTAQSLYELPILVSFLGYAGLWAAGLASVRKRPAASFLVLWFLITAAPICFGVALLDLRLDDVLFEHRIYLPGAGLLVLAASGLTFLLGKFEDKKLRFWATACLVLMLFALAFAAHERNCVWKSKVSLWKDVVEKAPRKWRGHYNLGNEYKAAGLTDRALEQYSLSVRIDPGYYEPYNNMGNIYLGKGLYGKAVENYQEAVTLNPNYTDAHYNMGIAYYYMGNLDMAVEQYMAALRLKPDDPEVHYNLGVAYLDQGNADLARREFEAVLSLEPGFGEARALLQKISSSSGGGQNKVR